MRVDDWRMPVTSPKEDCAAGGANTIVACWRMPVVSTLFTICIGCEVPLVAAATNSQFKRLYIASVKSPILRGRTFHPQIHNKRQVQRRIRISKMYKHTHTKLMGRCLILLCSQPCKIIGDNAPSLVFMFFYVRFYGFVTAVFYPFVYSISYTFLFLRLGGPLPPPAGLWSAPKTPDGSKDMSLHTIHLA